MDVVLGLLGLIVYLVGVIALAAAVTWAVVRLTPAAKPKPASPASSD